MYFFSFCILLASFFFFLHPVAAQTIRVPQATPSGTRVTSAPVSIRPAVSFLLERFSSHASRMEDVTARLTSRMESMKKEKREIPTIERDMQTLTQQMRDIRTQSALLEQSSQEFSDDGKPVPSFSRFKQQSRTLLKTMQTAHTLQKQIVTRMKQVPSGALSPTSTQTGL